MDKGFAGEEGNEWAGEDEGLDLSVSCEGGRDVGGGKEGGEGEGEGNECAGEDEGLD